MEHRIKKLIKSEVEIEVILRFSEFEPHVKRAAGLISEENEIEGFRKGKAPYDIVKQKFGEMAIYEKAADLAIRKTYGKVFEELVTGNQLSATNPPIGSPEITVTKLAPGNDFEYKIKVAVLPEVRLSNYRASAQRVLQKEKKEVGVSDEEVKKAIDWLRESRTKLITLDRPAEKGDRVEVDFEIRHGGVKIADGDSKNHPLILGRNKFMPGFEDELVGMKQGEEKSFTLKVPDDWREKSVAGKALEFKVKLNLVQKREVPDLNDEFVKSLGEFSSVDLLQKNIREGILEEKKEKEKERLRSRILEEIAKDAKIEVPEVLVVAEIDKMTEDLKSSISDMGMKWEDYLLHVKKTVEDLRKDCRGQAEIRVRVALCLGEIAKVEKIEPGEEEIKERADKFLAQFKSVNEAEKEIDAENLREYIKGILRNEKVLKLLEGLSEKG